MKIFLRMLAAGLIFSPPTWAGECADLVAPVISGRSIGAKIRALALTSGEDFETKQSVNLALRVIEATGTEIQTPDPYFFMDDVMRESTLRHLSLLPDVAPEISKDQVKTFRQKIEDNNLYHAGFMEVTADEFTKLTQEGRHRLVAGTRQRRWLLVQDLDPYDFKNVELPKEMSSFGTKAQKIEDIKLVLVSEIRNREGLIGYRAIYQTKVKDRDARFEYYYTAERRPMSQEVDLRFR